MELLMFIEIFIWNFKKDFKAHAGLKVDVQSQFVTLETAASINNLPTRSI